MKLQHLSFALPVLFLFFTITSCKKQTDVVNTAQQLTATVDSVANTKKALDSALMITRDIYFWYNQIPAGFDAQSYTDPNEIMEAIRQYSIEAGFIRPVDKWSFAIKQKDWENQSNGIVMNTSTDIIGDFGLTVFFRAEGDLRVRLVEKNSPAGTAGIHRSWRITKINGNSNINTANSVAIIENVYKSSSTTFTFLKPDGNTVDIILNASAYKTQPVYLDTIYNYSRKKIGYMVFNSFLGDTSEIYNGFERIFTKFANAGIKDAVIDLRYNGGGYVSVQEQLADYLVSVSADNNLMFKKQFNDKNSAFNSSTNFHKTGPLNLNHLYFIVSNSTASASELLINNLKPYMDVQLVGPSNTYGKPVGFFPIAVSDWYIFPVSFKSTNKNGVGEYFNGLEVNSKVADGLDKDWGDVTESCLASVIRRITTGSYLGQATHEFTDLPQQVKLGNNKLDAPLFKGAIGSTIKLR